MRVFVTTHVERPQKAHAPTGKGVRTRPAMVERKMARRVHASGTTPAGQGMTNLTTRPRAMDRTAGVILAPFHTKPPPPLAGGSEAAASPAAATTAPPPLVALATTEGDVERGEKGTRLLLLPAAPVDVRRATPRNAPGRLADWPRG